MMLIDRQVKRLIAQQYCGQKDPFPSLTVDVVPGAVTRGVKPPYWTGVPDRLAHAREEAGIAQRELARLSALSLGVVHQIEARKSIPGVNTVERLADSLGVDPCWLAFGWDGEQPVAQRIRRLIDPDPPPSPEPAGRACEERFRGIPGRLRDARVAVGCSMRALAELAGLSVQAVSAMESGASVPIISNLESIAVALKVSPCWLAFGVGLPPRAPE